MMKLFGILIAGIGVQGLITGKVNGILSGEIERSEKPRYFFAVSAIWIILGLFIAFPLVFTRSCSIG